MIRYHGTPITPNEALLTIIKQYGHTCVSYANQGQLRTCLEWCRSVMLDNGAFSAWKSGVKFDFDGFMDWVEEYGKHPAVGMVIVPDVIGGGIEENDEMLREAIGRNGKMPWVPVYHMDEDLSRLERLVDEFPYVAIGSSGEFASIGDTKWWVRMTEMMGVACDGDGYPKARLHGLRQMDATIFSHVPYASVDSTGVAQNIGIDKKWTGPYAPESRWVRALVLADRAESHATAKRWTGSAGIRKNYELFG